MYRKISMIFFLFLLCALVNGQSLDNVKRHIYLEQYSAAKVEAKRMISNDIASSEASCLLAEIYLKEKNIKLAQDLLLAFPGQPFYGKEKLKDYQLLNVVWGHILLDSGDTVAAKAKFEEVLDIGKYKDPVTLLAVAKANIASKYGNALWAIELVNKALKKSKNNPELYVALGDAYRKIVDGGNAISNYNKALEVNPNYAEAMYKNGMIYKTQNNATIYLDRFLKAYALDSTYTPVIYELYYYYYFHDINMADQYLQAYLRHVEPAPENEYLVADLKFVSRKYKEAITVSKHIIQLEGDSAQPRLYKLIAYSYAELGDSAAARPFIDTYLEKQNPEDFVAKDFILKARLIEKADSNKAAPAEWYEKAISLEKDSTERLGFMAELASIYKGLGQRDKESVWRERIVKTKNPPGKLDLYNWGIALFAAENYIQSDSVFGLYIEKYPDEVYGYLWRARSNALIDTTMQMGLAVPYYKMLIGVAQKDIVKNKALLLRSFQYLGSYEANITKDFASSLAYYHKILELNPSDTDAEKSASILTKLIEKGEGSN